MDGKTSYLIELFYSQVERENCLEAESLLKLLTPRLPPGRVKRLRAEIPVEQKIHHSVERKQRSKEQQREKEIRDIVAERKIDYLVHFTQAFNVASILRYGLIPRKRLSSKLGSRYKDVRVNDQWRLDRHTDASCLSISFPNYQMFFRYRKNYPNITWAVLLINPKVLWEWDCAFYNCNAASRKWKSISVEKLKPVSIFKALFDDYKDDKISVERSQLHVANFHTTNPQAEVLVFDIIPTEDIFAVCLPYTNDAFPEYAGDWQGVDVRFDSVYFGRRVDYDIWSTSNKELADQ